MFLRILLRHTKCRNEIETSYVVVINNGMKLPENRQLESPRSRDFRENNAILGNTVEQNQESRVKIGARAADAPAITVGFHLPIKPWKSPPS